MASQVQMTERLGPDRRTLRLDKVLVFNGGWPDCHTRFVVLGERGRVGYRKADRGSGAPSPDDVRHSEPAVLQAMEQLTQRPVIAFEEAIKKTRAFFKSGGET